jgi:hypothetical protein
MAREALEELYAFAARILHALHDMEVRGTGNSSLKQFCRIDLGFIITEEGEAQYFVSEVDRGPNVCLWAGQRLPHLVGEVAERLGPALYSWIEKNVTPKIL